MRVLEHAPQSDGWPQVLSFLDKTLECRSFLAEYDSSGTPSPRYGGQRPARQLATMLQQIETEGGRDAFQFLLADAALKYPYCKTSLTRRLREEPLLQASSADEARQIEALQLAPGLIAPVRKSGRSTVLFGVLFTAHTPETVDVALASETFRTIVDALSAGVTISCSIETERLDGDWQRLLLSHVGSPCVLVTEEGDILAQTANAVDALNRSGIAHPQRDRLVVDSKKLDAALVELAVATRQDAHGRPVHTDPLPHRALCFPDGSGSLLRLEIQTVSPGTSAPDRSTDTIFLIRLSQSRDIPGDVEKCLQDHYDLSQSEAHLARQLTLTGSMHMTIEALGITRNTAKTHLRRVYEKTGVNTQLQLARLVHRLAQLF